VSRVNFPHAGRILQTCSLAIINDYFSHSIRSFTDCTVVKSDCSRQREFSKTPSCASHDCSSLQKCVIQANVFFSSSTAGWITLLPVTRQLYCHKSFKTYYSANLDPLQCVFKACKPERIWNSLVTQDLCGKCAKVK
jgi:hypothetical protein